MSGYAKSFDKIKQISFVKNDDQLSKNMIKLWIRPSIRKDFVTLLFSLCAMKNI